MPINLPKGCTVARRNILVARIRQELQADNLDVARTLIAELDDLPGRAQFNRQLNEQEGRHRSGEAQIQRRIDKLFADTRIVLGHFLDSREVDQLRDELRAAQSGG